MHLLGQRNLGIAILLLLGILVIVKRIATGSVMNDKPEGGLRIWLTHLFNLSFLLIVNPVVAILLIARQLEISDPTHLDVYSPRLLRGLEISGLMLYVIGLLLMAWALIRLGNHYQVGGSSPRVSDEMILAGPYRFIRHPMYSAALCISLGLAAMVQSLAFFVFFVIYLVLIVLLIPQEEEGLRKAYSQGYLAYQQKVKKLVPYLF